LAALIAVVVALAGCGGGEDPRPAVVKAVAALQQAVGSSAGQVDGVAVCDGLDARTSAAVGRLGPAITGEAASAGCSDVLGIARWRVRPIVALGDVGVGRVRVDGDVATVAPIGTGTPVRMVRDGDRWRADLLADPRWRYRLERLRACTAAGRRFARQPLPVDGPEAVTGYLRQQVAILRRFERDVDVAPAPGELRGPDARMRGTLRAVRRRAEERLRRSRGGTAAAAAAIASLTRRGWDPAAQLPTDLSRRTYPITEGCLSASTPAANPGVARSVARRCESAIARMREFDGVTSAADYRRRTGRVIAALGAVRRVVNRATPPAPVWRVHLQTVREMGTFIDDLRRLVGRVEAADLPGVRAIGSRLRIRGVALDRGLTQLGLGCAVPAPAAPARTSRA
jgi:hypothetical protein